MATLKMFILGNDTTIQVQISNKTAYLMISNFKQSGATYNINKYKDKDIRMVDTIFYFCSMVLVITMEEFKEWKT